MARFEMEKPQGSDIHNPCKPSVRSLHATTPFAEAEAAADADLPQFV
jgi:hypothetical protein